MSDALYEVISLGMRYVFAGLGLLIVLRTFIWLLKEHHERHQQLNQLPDAGTVGRLLVLDGGDCYERGEELVLPYEGTLGAMRTCDVPIPSQQLALEHLDFSFQPQLGLLLYLRRGMTCMADGVELNDRSRPREHPLRHGSVLQVGDVTLRVRLFDGLRVGGPAWLQPDEAVDEADPPVEQPMEEEPPEQQSFREDCPQTPVRYISIFEPDENEEPGRWRSKWRRDDDE